MSPSGPTRRFYTLPPVVSRRTSSVRRALAVTRYTCGRWPICTKPAAGAAPRSSRCARAGDGGDSRRWLRDYRLRDTVHAVEIRRQVDRERWDLAVRLPHQRLDESFDRRIVGACPFHRALIGIDDPVVGDSLLPVQRALPTAVGPLGGRSDDLDGEEEPANVGPRAHRHAV